MDTELLILGGGFWGAASALLAERAGRSVVVLDADMPQAASRNAAGLVTMEWYSGKIVDGLFPPGWGVRDAEAGKAFLEETAGLQKTGKHFYSKLGRDPHYKADCYILPSLRALLDKPTCRVKEKVKTLRIGAQIVAETESGETYRAARCILAAGAFTDRLLEASGLPTVGVSALQGRALLLTPPPLAEYSVPLSVLTRPYTFFTLRPWEAGQVRIGDTVEKKFSPAFTETADVSSIRRIRENFVPGATGERWLTGLRPVCKTFHLQPVAPGENRVLVATGGHRVGMALAGAVGQRAYRFLFGDGKAELA